MTQTSNKLFDDFAKLLTNAAGAAQGVRREVDTVMRSQAERILNELDVVSREEFDAVRDMAAKAREENDALEQRIAVLEAKLGAKAKPAAKSKPAAKPARSRKAAKPGSAGKTS
jgi:BMFP domain-containing protein YqiC